ncbi:Uncharacterised protein [Edwardsiella tarda]|nr:Uncharacterised protein [Edwardsiella tarda]
MMKIKESEAKNTYAAYALGATRAEWRKDYQTAAPLWEKAAASPASVRCRNGPSCELSSATTQRNVNGVRP